MDSFNLIEISTFHVMLHGNSAVTNMVVLGAIFTIQFVLGETSSRLVNKLNFGDLNNFVYENKYFGFNKTNEADKANQNPLKK